MERPSRRANTNDDDLVRSCLGGDESAWKELVDRYGRLVYSIPLRYGLTAVDADEVFQNVFIVVHRRLSTLRDYKLLAPWLITVAHRESQHYCKRLRNDPELDEAIPDGTPPPLENVRRWELQYLVRHALGQLDDRCRELLTALFLEDTRASYAEIAKRFGIGPGSIGPTRARCFKKLEGILKAQDIDLDLDS